MSASAGDYVLVTLAITWEHYLPMSLHQPMVAQLIDYYQFVTVQYNAIQCNTLHGVSQHGE